MQLFFLSESKRLLQETKRFFSESNMQLFFLLASLELTCISKFKQGRTLALLSAVFVVTVFFQGKRSRMDLKFFTW